MNYKLDPKSKYSGASLMKTFNQPTTSQIILILRTEDFKKLE